jgi:hypothetical protein
MRDRKGADVSVVDMVRACTLNFLGGRDALKVSEVVVSRKGTRHLLVRHSPAVVASRLLAPGLR